MPDDAAFRSSRSPRARPIPAGAADARARRRRRRLPGREDDHTLYIVANVRQSPPTCRCADLLASAPSRPDSSSGSSRWARTTSSCFCRSRARRSASPSRRRWRAAAARASGAPTQSRLIFVLGPKGGTGKTLTATNLAVALRRPGGASRSSTSTSSSATSGSRLGLRPTHDDPRPRRAEAARSTGHSRDDGRARVRRATCSSPRAAPTTPAASPSSSIREIYTLAAARVRRRLVDTPPGFTPEVIASIDMATDLIMVGMLDSLSLKNMKLGLDTLDLMGVEADRVHARPQPRPQPGRYLGRRRRAVLGGKPDVLVPSDREIPRSINAGRTDRHRVAPESEAAIAFRSSRARYRRRCRTPATAPGRTRRSRVQALRKERNLDGTPRAPYDQPARVARPTRAVRRAQDRVHLRVITELGSQLTDVATDPATLRQRVLVDIKHSLAEEAGISRDEREQLANEIASDILGYGPLEPLLADDVDHRDHGQRPRRDLRRARRASSTQTTVRFNDEAHLRRIIDKIVAQVGRRIDESLADGRRPPARRLARQRDHPAARRSTARCLTIRKFSPRPARRSTTWSRSARSPTDRLEFLEALRRGRLNILDLGRHRHRQDDAAERALAASFPTTSASSRSRTRPSCSCSSATWSASRRARRTSRARARSRSATSCATRCACAPTGSSSARSAAARRSTCSRR